MNFLHLHLDKTKLVTKVTKSIGLYTILHLLLFESPNKLLNVWALACLVIPLSQLLSTWEIGLTLSNYGVKINIIYSYSYR